MPPHSRTSISTVLAQSISIPKWPHSIWTFESVNGVTKRCRETELFQIKKGLNNAKRVPILSALSSEKKDKKYLKNMFHHHIHSF